MKAKKTRLPWVLPVMAGALILPTALAQQASTTEWNADPGTPGDWLDTTWSDGVPAADSLAGILNGGTVGVTSPTATLEQLHLGGGSTLNVGALLGIEGTNEISNPEPDPATPATGLIVNEGTLNVTAGGGLQVTLGGEFLIGNEATALLTLGPGGAITTDLQPAVGSNAAGNGTFTQTGGVLTHSGEDFKVGGWGAVGQLNLSGGQFNVNQLRLAFGSGAPGTVNQTGGDMIASGGSPMSLGWSGSAGGDATYNLSGGTVTTSSRIRMGIGGNGPRTHLFNQTGGEVYVGGGGDGRIDIGENAANTPTYSISGGTLTTENRILCGAHGDGIGILDVSGFASVETFGLFVGNNPTNTGTVNVGGDADVRINQFEVRNGSVTHSGAGSFVDALDRFYVGTTQTESQTATYNLLDGTLTLFENNIIGNGNPGDATLNIEGGTFDSFKRLRVGVGAADGSRTPTNLVNQTGGEVIIGGRLDIGENPGPTNIYQISGGSLTATDNVLVGFFSDGTGVLTVDGSAEVDVPAVVMGENAGTNLTGTKGTVNLLGGTLTTGQIRVGNGLTGDQTLVLDGGTIRARTGGSTLIAGNVTTASLLAGGITFDTDGLDASTAGIMTGPGGITKTGAGTLTVNSVQAYTGATRVEEGTLILTQPYLADNGDVHLTTGSVLELSHTDTDTIGTLYINGVPQPVGTYGGTATGADTELAALMAGTGVLNATSSGAPAEPPVVTSISVVGGIATIAIHGAPATNYVCRFSDDLVTPFAPIVTDPETITTDAEGNASFTVDAGVGKRFYVVAEEE